MDPCRQRRAAAGRSGRRATRVCDTRSACCPPPRSASLAGRGCSYAARRSYHFLLQVLEIHLVRTAPAPGVCPEIVQAYREWCGADLDESLGASLGDRALDRQARSHKVPHPFVLVEDERHELVVLLAEGVGQKL